MTGSQNDFQFGQNRQIINNPAMEYHGPQGYNAPQHQTDSSFHQLHTEPSLQEMTKPYQATSQTLRYTTGHEAGHAGGMGFSEMI